MASWLIERARRKRTVTAFYLVAVLTLVDMAAALDTGTALTLAVFVLASADDLEYMLP